VGPRSPLCWNLVVLLANALISDWRKWDGSYTRRGTQFPSPQFCILYFVFCISYFVFCIKYSVFRVPYSVFCILYYVLCIMYYVFCIQYSVFCILYFVICVIMFLYSVFCTLYSVFCFLKDRPPVGSGMISPGGERLPLWGVE
jgi:predicted ferric reductase